MIKFLLAVLCLLCGLAWAEFREWLPLIARKIVEKAVLALPSEHQPRMLEELTGELGAIPGKISPFIFACSAWWGFWKAKLMDNLNRSASEYMLRALDLVLAAFLMLLMLPVFFLMLLASKIVHGEFGLRRTRCYGRNRTTFDLLRFYTKHPLSGQVTNVGRFVHCTRLDSLPIFINVLRGELSLVGPSPFRPFKSNCEEAKLKPGLVWFDSMHSLGNGDFGVSLLSTLRTYFYVIGHAIRVTIFGSNQSEDRDGGRK